MIDNAWFLMTTRDGMTAHLAPRRSERYPLEDLEGMPVAPAPAARRSIAPLFRRFRTAAA